MRHRTVSRAFVLVASVLTVLGGCALPTVNDQSRARPDSQQGFQPLAVGARNGDLDTLDPALIQFPGDYGIAQLIFPALVTLDERNQVAPWAAERWETSADGLIWAFHLHSGMSLVRWGADRRQHLCLRTQPLARPVHSVTRRLLSLGHRPRAHRGLSGLQQRCLPARPRGLGQEPHWEEHPRA